MYDDDGIGCGGSNGGRPIESYTGYLGYMYGGDVQIRHYNMFGYPAAPPFNGTIMVEAQSDAGDENLFGETDTFSAGSDMTGGSSGGPWLVTFSPGAAGSTNYAYGLNSFKWVVPDRPLEMNSPKFLSDNFVDLITFAQGLACP